MAAQDFHADRMEGAEPRHALDHAADDLADAVLHLARRLVGEGDGEDLARPGAAGGEDVGDAHGEHARLAGAGAGQHQHRPVERLDREPLLRIEAGEIGRRRRRRSRARGNAARRRRRWRGRIAGLSPRVSQGASIPDDSHSQKMALCRGNLRGDQPRRACAYRPVRASRGIAMPRPAPSGTGRCACAAFMRASRAATASGKAAVLRAFSRRAAPCSRRWPTASPPRRGRAARNSASAWRRSRGAERSPAPGRRRAARADSAHAPRR